MNARRIFAAAAIVVATASGAACSGGSPTASNSLVDQPATPPIAEPTDTTGFVPPAMVP
jgi:hypothetical protein